MTKGVKPVVQFPELERRYKAYLAHNKSLRGAAMSMGIERTSFRNSIRAYEAAVPNIEFPDFPATSFAD